MGTIPTGGSPNWKWERTRLEMGETQIEIGSPRLERGNQIRRTGGSPDLKIGETIDLEIKDGGEILDYR